jgi:dipeptidyl aminopeptidase/acylaminoacyl peptidase
MAPPRPFRPADLLREVQLREPAVSPDGEWVVYARRTIENSEYRKRLWRVPYSGGRPQQLTTGELDGRPRFSPDGRTLLFLSKRNGGVQPWLLPLRGGEPRQLCELAGGVGAAEWSPDGERVLLLGSSGVGRFIVGDAERPTARRIDVLPWRLDGVGVLDQTTSAWVVGSGGGRARRVTEPTVQIWGACWETDGKRIAYLADYDDLGVFPQAWSVSLDGGRPRLLARLAGEVENVAFAPDGTLAVIGIDDPPPTGWQNFGLFVRRGRSLQRLGADLDRPIAPRVIGDLVTMGELFPAPLAWLDDEHVVALVTDRGEVHPYAFGLDGGVERLAGGPVVCVGLAVGGGHLAVVAAERGRPSEICAVEGGALRPLTRHGSRWFASFRRDPERIAVPHRDGHELDAWLLRGHGARRRRLVVQIHGGPHLAHGWTPWLEMVALASAGFSILYANPRGSVGYGEQFAGAIAGDWGTADTSDVLRLVDWSVREGIADPTRIGLLGLSYGGFMTTWLLGREPGRFRAAVSENPVTDVLGHYGSSDVGWLIARSLAGLQMPGEDWQRTLDRSPVRDIHRNEAPLLLLQAEDDFRCPAGQSDVVFAILRALGRKVELVRYPDESHLLLAAGRPDRRVDRIERIVDWFVRYL